MHLFSIIITAGGIGKRMGGDLPKQFMDLGGKSILLHTLEVFHKYDPTAQLILTLPGDWKKYWVELLQKENCTIPHEIVDGGKERYDSIKNALTICKGEYIAVHDGVRPFVSNETLSRCFESVKDHGQVVPVIPVKESMRQLFDDTSRAVNRAEFCIVQTPQCFKKEILVKSYQNAFHSELTDDASLVEEAGFLIHLVEGNEENIKITSKMDLLIAETLLESREKL